MIVYNIDAYPRVTVQLFESKWEQSEYDTFIAGIKEIFEFARKNGDRIKLIVEGNAELRGGKGAPFRIWMSLAKDLVLMKPLIKEALDRTAIIKPYEDFDSCFDILFKLYKPARPLKFFKTPEFVEEWLEKNL